MNGLDDKGLPRGYPFNADWEIAPREFVRRRDSRQPMVLLDCRTDAEREIATIADSVHVPMNLLMARLPELRAHEGTPIVVYCHHGARSLQVTATLREAGFDEVHSLAGGIHLWSLDIDPSVPVY